MALPAQSTHSLLTCGKSPLQSACWTIASAHPRDPVRVVYVPEPGTSLVSCGAHGPCVSEGMVGVVTVEEASGLFTPTIIPGRAGLAPRASHVRGP